MLSELASVFLSQGARVGRGGYQYVYSSGAGEKAIRSPGTLAKDPAGENRFVTQFEQASSRLELSKHAQATLSKRETESTSPPLEQEDSKKIEEMAKRERQVHAHEMAHVASAGGVAKGGAKFEYEVGPDGKAYAVSGHVNIDTSSIAGNPEATLQKAQKIKQAALAPADPSGQDRSVAVAAANMALEAQKEIAAKAGIDSNGKALSKEPARSPYSSGPATRSTPIGKSVNVYA